jgi:hypothetical protein
MSTSQPLNACPHKAFYAGTLDAVIIAVVQGALRVTHQMPRSLAVGHRNAD